MAAPTVGQPIADAELFGDIDVMERANELYFTKSSA
jgi:hypothetical protein